MGIAVWVEPGWFFQRENSLTVEAQDIIEFWFDDEVKKLWFNSNPDFDKKIKDMFEKTYEAGVKGLLTEWEKTAEGSLALVILYDQFPLNMYRGDRKGFETEALSRRVAAAAIENNFDQEMSLSQRGFLYVPFMHSENLDDQQTSVDLFEAAGLVENLRFAKHHQNIVKKYGRFPHRNLILGRKNTDEELEYLNSDEAFHG